MIVSINIDPSCSDDYIQAQLFKCIFILRHRQNISKPKYLDPVAYDAKWEVFWGAVSRYSLSIVRNEDESYDVLNNYSLLYKDEYLDDWKNGMSWSPRNKWEVSISTSEWLPLHCCVFNSTDSGEYHKVLCSLACIEPLENNKNAVKTKDTPLHLAIASKNPNMEIIKNLIKYFSSMTSVETDKGEIPLHYAAMSNCTSNVEVIEMLIAAYPQGLEKKCCKGEVPMFKACRNISDNNLQIVQKLLDASPHSIRSTNNDGETPLHTFVSELYNSSDSSVLVDIIKILLIAYPDSVTIQDNNGNTPFHILCCIMNSDEAILSIFEQMLSASPVAVSIQNNEQQTPLHLFLRGANGQGKDFNSLVPLLLDVYPEAVSVMDDKGCYPIHYAVLNDLDLTHIERIINGYPDALLALGTELISMDISISAEDSFRTSRTPIQMSLVRYSDTPSDSVSYDRLALVKYLYSRCPESIHIRSGIDNNTLLYTAVRYCNDRQRDEIVKAVYRMDPSAAMSVNNIGDTPLSAATSIALDNPNNYPFSNLEQVRFLLRIYPDAITLSNKYGLSPLVEVLISYSLDGGDVVHRMVLQSVPDANPKELCRLNYEARRMALFVFFTAIFEEAKGNDGRNDNVKIKLALSISS